MTDVNSLFRRFEATLRMSPNTVDSVRQRYRRITWRLNQDFWNINSDTEHSWYAGSYGRGTAISTSDIDILVELPSDLYKRYWTQSLVGQNGPSRLLQTVKNSLQQTYPATRLRGDGQVVVVEFSDGVRFEVVPVFSESYQTLIYPDTHNGGRWLQMKPALESHAFTELSRMKPGGLKKFCRMLRAFNKKYRSPLSGQAIDAMAYEYWDFSSWSEKLPYTYFDWHVRDFFAYWKNEFSRGGVVLAPGSQRHIQVSDLATNIELFNTFHDIAQSAIKYENQGNTEFWRLIFGEKFPES